MLHKFIKSVAPIAAIALAAGLSGCDRANVQFGDTEGVPLADLDMSGPAPTELILAGPDLIKVTQGEKLDIQVSGDSEAVAALRFTLEDGALAIMRDNDARDINGRADVNVTMPALEKIIIAGSGEVEADGLARESELVIAGSGLANVSNIDGESLDITVAGSGSIKAEGNVERMDLNIAGSGNAGMRALNAVRADVNIAGSGNADFSSDGEVEANIVGSGNVSVTGSAKCTVQSFGSGTVTCQSGSASGGEQASEEAASAETAATKPKKAKRTAKASKLKRKSGKASKKGPRKA